LKEERDDGMVGKSWIQMILCAKLDEKSENL
jgi:hypothetical protein